MRTRHNSYFAIFVCAFYGLVATLPCQAQQNSLVESLGVKADVITRHDSASTTQLKVVSVNESIRYALSGGDRIAGYPAAASLHTLKREHAKQLALIVSQKNNYVAIRQRCKNDLFHGVRYSKQQERVELAIGVPCRQVVVAFRDGQEIAWWGGVLTPEAMAQASKLLESR